MDEHKTKANEQVHKWSRVPTTFPCLNRIPQSSAKQIGFSFKGKFWIERVECSWLYTLDWLTLLYGVHQLPKSWLLFPTAKPWGSQCYFGEFWKEAPQDKGSWQPLGPNPRIFQPDQLAPSSRPSRWLHQYLLSSPNPCCSPHDRPIFSELGSWGKE